MRKGIIILGIILLVLVSSGCTSPLSTLETYMRLSPSALVICPTGEKVSDPSLCPKGTTTPSTTMPVPVYTTTLAPTPVYTTTLAPTPVYTTTLAPTPETTQPPTTTPVPTTVTPPTTTPAPMVLAKKPVLKWKKPIVRLTTVSVSEDGNYIAVGSDKQIYLLDISGLILWNEYLGVPIEKISVSNDGLFIRAVSQGKVLYLFNNGKLLNSDQIWYSSTPFSTHHFSVSDYGQYILAGSTGDKMDGNVYVKNSLKETYIKGYRVKSGSLTKYEGDVRNNIDSIEIIKNRGIMVYDVSVSRDGSFLVVVTGSYKSGYTYLFSIKEDGSGNFKWKHELGGSDIRPVSISPDGKYVAVGNGVSLDFLDQAGKKLWSYHVGYYITDISVSDDGNLVAIASKDKNMLLLNKQGELLLKYETGQVVSLSVSSDGRHVVVNSIDNNIYFFEK